MTEKQKSDLVKIAKSLVGEPYKYGASPKEAPKVFDCSSFTQYVFKQVGIELPRSTILQAECGNEVKLEDIQPGDLLFFHGTRGFYNQQFPQGVGHVTLYIGNGKTIHAASRRIREKPAVIEEGQVEENHIEEIIEKLKPLVIIKRN